MATALIQLPTKQTLDSVARVLRSRCRPYGDGAGFFVAVTHRQFRATAARSTDRMAVLPALG